MQRGMRGRRWISLGGVWVDEVEVMGKVNTRFGG